MPLQIFLTKIPSKLVNPDDRDLEIQTRSFGIPSNNHVVWNYVLAKWYTKVETVLSAQG